MVLPHPDPEPRSVPCAIVTVSDTRTIANDHSGQLLQTLLQEAGHQIVDYRILRDEPTQIAGWLQALCTDAAPEADAAEAVIFTGGTGIAARDTTYDAISQLLEKQLPGFGELFRWLSYQDIGSRAIASRAVAGTYGTRLIFSLPGSTNAVRLAMTALILPELPHLVRQLRG
jgi:molybdenum cofactor biosynthesis protein B